MSGMVITLKKSKFDSFGDLLDGLLSKLGNYESTVQDLKNTVASIGCEKDNQVSSNLGSAIDAIVDSEDSKEEKKEKINALKQKIETFVNNSVQHERAAADKIKEKKKDFYKNYEYLKPDCEKSFLEKVGEGLAYVGKKIGEWVSDNIIALIVAAVIVVAAIVVVIVCPAAVVAIIAVVVGALSAAMGIADLILIATTGDDLAGLIEGDGSSRTRHILSQLYKGLGWGLDIASVILPMGAIPSAGAGAYKSTFSELRHPFQALKKLGNNSAIKNFGNMLKHPILSLKGFAGDGIKKIGKAFSGFGDGIGKGFAHLGKSGLKGVISFTGADKLLDGFKLGFGATVRHMGLSELSSMAYKSLGLDDLAGLCYAGGTKESDYNQLLTANNGKLSTAAGSNNITSTFGEMEVPFDPASVDKRDAFFNGVKGDRNLSEKLLETTGIDISDISNKGDLKKALTNSGYTFKFDVPSSGGNGKVSIVPTWANKALDGNSGTLKVMESLGNGANGVNYSFRRGVIQEYNKYVTTKLNIVGGNMASDLFKKNMEYKVFEFGADMVGEFGQDAGVLGEDGVPNSVKTAVKAGLSPWF